MKLQLEDSLLTLIPQANPLASYEAQKDAIDSAVRKVLQGGWYILGDEVRSFEKRFASYIGCAHGVGVASGTDAIEIALRAFGVGAGDVVFTVSHTAVATVAAIERTGAQPFLVDINPQTYTMDPQSLSDSIEEQKRTKRGIPKAIIPVHIYGHPADMRSILQIARRSGLVVIEDCAQAHGAEIDGKRVGSLGDASAFSFYPTKNLGAFGDGGIVCCNDDSVAEKVMALREYGWRQRYESDLPGINSRLDEVQAAILNVKFVRLQENNARRKSIALSYSESLGDKEIVSPVESVGCKHVFHLYVVKCTNPTRDRLQAYLKSQLICTAIHYPMPVHLQRAYKGRVGIPANGLKNTESLIGSIVSLPLFPELSQEDSMRVCDALRYSSRVE
jgi:dTDP-4-amino-4,6-dideoxygalactose transaminase